MKQTGTCWFQGVINYDNSLLILIKQILKKKTKKANNGKITKNFIAFFAKNSVEKLNLFEWHFTNKEK